MKRVSVRVSEGMRMDWRNLLQEAGGTAGVVVGFAVVGSMVENKVVVRVAAVVVDMSAADGMLAAAVCRQGVVDDIGGVPSCLVEDMDCSVVRTDSSLVAAGLLVWEMVRVVSLAFRDMTRAVGLVVADHGSDGVMNDVMAADRTGSSDMVVVAGIGGWLADEWRSSHLLT